MRVLVDLDDVITDFEGRLLKLWREIHPNIELFPGGLRQKYYIGYGLNEEYLADLWHILHGPGFFSSLEPLAGSLEAVEAMVKADYEVFIVTSAGVSFPLAATEKYQWVKDNCDPHLLAHLMITPSKFLVKGDILIDDKPELHREDEADWEHILFDRTYNRSVENKRRLDWENWQEVLANSS